MRACARARARARVCVCEREALVGQGKGGNINQGGEDAYGHTRFDCAETPVSPLGSIWVAGWAHSSRIAVAERDSPLPLPPRCEFLAAAAASPALALLPRSMSVPAASATHPNTGPHHAQSLTGEGKALERRAESLLVDFRKGAGRAGPLCAPRGRRRGRFTEEPRALSPHPCISVYLTGSASHLSHCTSYGV